MNGNMNTGKNMKESVNAVPGGSCAGDSISATRAFEKRALRSVLIIIGTACIANILFDFMLLYPTVDSLSRLLGLAARYICRLCGGAQAAAGLAGAAEIYEQLYDLTLYTVSMGVQLLLLAAAARLARRSGLVCVRTDGSIDADEKAFVYRNLPAILFFSFLVAISFSWITAVFMGDGSYAESTFPETDAGAAIYFVSLAVLPPLLEEIAYRGILQRALLPFGKRFAVIISATVFAVGHSGFSSMAYAFVWGILLGTVAANTGSLIPGIIIHFVNNGIFNFADQYLAERFPQTFETMSPMFTALYCILGFLSLYLLFGRKNKLAVGDGYAGALSERERFEFAANPMLLLYFGLQILFTLLNMLE